MINIYGKNCIKEAVKANIGIKKIFLLDSIVTKEKNFLQLLDDKKIKYEIANKAKMDNMFGHSHQGYGAQREDYTVYDDKVVDLLNGENKRILILDGIMDPHNFGAIIRSVDAFGYDAIVLPNNRSVRITETVAHVSTGAIEHVKIAYVNSLSTFIKRLKDNDYWICGTDASGNTLISQIDKDRNLAVIIGSEGFGMSKTLVNLSDYLITIPMVGHVNSLNASVSAGIVLHGLGKK